MDLDMIQQEKKKEAEQFFLEIGLDPNKESRFQQVQYPIREPKVLESDKKLKFVWTRLSINSNIGSMVE